MGVMLQRSGIGDDLYDLFYRWLGPLRGGLAAGTLIICGMFAAMCGISGAATVTMGLLALPSMLKRGYAKSLAIGSIAAGGALGVLIPPSVMMVIWAFISQQSVGRLFLGGILPGIILLSMFVLYVLIRAWLNPSLAPPLPKEDRGTLKEKFSSLKGLVLPIALIIAVLGSIFGGLATPTEAAAVGAVGAIIVSAVNRRLNWTNLKSALYQTLGLTAMIMWIIIGVNFFNNVYISLGAPDMIRDVMSNVPGGKWITIIVIQLIWFILGCLLDPNGIMLITGPIFIPVVEALGFDLIWFGVIFVINMEMSYLTPPYGFNLFYLKSIVPKEVSMRDIYTSVGPFVGLQAACLVICMIFPKLVTWLPNLVFGASPGG